MQKRNNNNPLVCVVILNYKNWHDTIDCIESVFRCTYDNFRVLVIDNDSQNDSISNMLDWAKSHFPDQDNLEKNCFNSQNLDIIREPSFLPPLVFIQNNENAGFAAGNNVVLRLLAGQDIYVWMLNPDMVIAENALFELVQFAKTKPSNTIIGSVVKFYDDPGKIQMYGGGQVKFRSGTISFIKNSGRISDLDYISGGAMFIHANLLEKFGLLPEKYFLYWEETDWCYSARLQGGTLAVCESSVVFDKVGTTIGRSYLAEFYYTRNGLLFLYKYKPENIPKALFYCRIRLLKKILQLQWKRAKGVYQGAESFKKMVFHENK